MIAASDAARWVRAKPRSSLPVALFQRMVHAAFPSARILDIKPLTGGLRNANFKILLSSVADPIVLRIFEHDPSLCQKEVDLLRLIGDSVPVPEVIYAEPHGLENIPPFTLVRYMEGITLRDLKRGGDAPAIAEASYSAGQVLASIGRITFPKSGWLAPGPSVSRPLLKGVDWVPRFVDLYLASENLQARMEPELRDRTHRLVGCGRHKLRVRPRSHAWFTAISASGTCWCEASRANGKLLAFWTGSLRYQARL